MDRAEFVHVVALVRSAACVQERKHSGNEQTRFVHGDRVGAGKVAHASAVFCFAVAEKERIVSREKMGEVAGLSDETTRHYYTVAYMSSRTDDEIFGRNIRPDVYRSLSVAVDTTVFESRCPVYLAVISDTNVSYSSCIDDVHAVAYFPVATLLCEGICLYHFSKAGYQVGAMPIHGDDVGQLCRQPIVNGYFPTSCLVQYRYFGIIPETAFAFGENEVYILYETVASYPVIGYIVGNVFYQ